MFFDIFSHCLQLSWRVIPSFVSYSIHYHLDTRCLWLCIQLLIFSEVLKVANRGSVTDDFSFSVDFTHAIFVWIFKKSRGSSACFFVRICHHITLCVHPCWHACSHMCPVPLLNLDHLQDWQNSTDVKYELFMSIRKFEARRKRVTVTVFPQRGWWKGNLTRHNNFLNKLMPSCIKAPSSGKTVGAYWENFWTLEWKSTENYPSLFSVLMKIWPTDCPTDIL